MTVPTKLDALPRPSRAKAKPASSAEPFEDVLLRMDQAASAPDLPGHAPAMAVVDPGYHVDDPDDGYTYVAPPAIDLSKMNPRVMEGAPAPPVVSVLGTPSTGLVQPQQGQFQNPAQQQQAPAPKYRVDIQSYFDPISQCSAIRQVLIPI